MIRFEIPGKPFAKQRPRFSRKSGRAFTPKETVSFEDTVRAIAAQEFSEPLCGPVEITVTAQFEPAASWSKKKTAEHIWQPHIQRPDADNIQKAILDGLNRIAFADDAQVASIKCTKLWGSPAKTTVEIGPLRGFL